MGYAKTTSIVRKRSDLVQLEKGGRGQAIFAREGREGQKEKKWKVNFVREGKEGAGELDESRRGGAGKLGEKREGGDR